MGSQAAGHIALEPLLTPTMRLCRHPHIPHLSPCCVTCSIPPCAPPYPSTNPYPLQ
jgi:hypothetical protein